MSSGKPWRLTAPERYVIHLESQEKTAFVYVAEISQELKVIHLESAVIWIKLFSLF